MRTQLRRQKIFGPRHRIIDPAYWEPSFILFAGGEGGGDGSGDNESAPDLFGPGNDRRDQAAQDAALDAQGNQGGGGAGSPESGTGPTGGGGGGTGGGGDGGGGTSMVDPNLLAAINAAASQFGIQTDAEGNFVSFQPVDFQDISSTQGDPRFKTMSDAVKQSIDIGQTETRQNQSEFFGRRRGGSGSTAELNAQTRLDRNLSADRDLKIGQLGIQEFGISSQIAESANRRKQLELATTSAGIELLSLPTQFDIAETAAKNMGDVGGDSGGGGGPFGK